MTVAGIKPLTYTIRCDCTNHQTTFPLILLCFLPLIPAFCSASCLKPFGISHPSSHSFISLFLLSFFCVHLWVLSSRRKSVLENGRNDWQIQLSPDGIWTRYKSLIIYQQLRERESACVHACVCASVCGCMCGREKVQFCPFFCSSSDAISSFLSLNDRASKPT